MPVVSVIMPYRDAADTIDEAIESVLGQRDVALELLAVDDGSSDDSAARVVVHARRDDRVRALVSSGRGIVPAIATGVARARGEFVARMDADDVSLPTRLARQVARLREDGRLAAVGCLVEAFPSNTVGEGLRRYVAWMNGLVTPEDHARDLFVEAPLCHPSVTMRRSALEHVGGFRDVRWPEDYDLWLRFDAAGFSLAKVPETLFRWRHRAGRLTFRDPRYALARFAEAKSEFLARRLSRLARPLFVWGAGPTGKQLARALETHGVRADGFIDVDPRKIGGVARGARIVDASAIERGSQTVVVAVGARGARDLVRAELVRRGFIEGDDFLCAS